MSDTKPREGTTTIAPEVLLTMIRMTTLAVPGVSRFANTSADVEKWFSKSMTDGIKLVIDHGVVTVDVFVIVFKDRNVRDIAHEIQTRISRAISEMVGMELGKVNVHIEDIDFS